MRDRGEMDKPLEAAISGTNSGRRWPSAILPLRARYRA
jgi:hypothetical protein